MRRTKEKKGTFLGGSQGEKAGRKEEGEKED